MIEIIVTVSIYIETDGDHPFHTVEVPLILEASAPLTPDDADPKSFGRWTCHYYYLGADLSGRYFVKNNKWLPANPCGFFLDSEGKDDDPFLVLQGFKPMGMKIGDGGEGRILRTRVTSVKFPNVSWRCSKTK